MAVVGEPPCLEFDLSNDPSVGEALAGARCQVLRRAGLTRGMITSNDDAVRTIVEIPDAQIKALARFCQREGVSRAEAIRRAVDKLVAGGEMAEAQQNLQAGFGLWRGRRPDGRGYVDALRAEWEERV